MAASSSTGSEVPLRKKIKTKSGIEHNFVPDYLSEKIKDIPLHQANEVRYEHNIQVSATCVSPVTSFKDLELPLNVLQVLERKGYQHPTPVQMQATTIVMSGRDLIAYAETGSGKTLAYVLPLCRLLLHFDPSKQGEGPLALILLPTRELAQQIYQYCRDFLDCLKTHSRGGGYSSLLVVGGVPDHQQLYALRRGVSVVIATPGKLLHLLSVGAVTGERLSYIVLDEVDRMLHRGMEDQIRQTLMTLTSSNRPKQTLLFSATMPSDLDRLARSAVLNPVIMQVGIKGLTATNLKQEVLFLHTFQKHDKLLDVLRHTSKPPVLVFVNAIATADTLVRFLKEEQFHAAGLHSEKPQELRFQVIKEFKKGRIDVLVATDLASRGLDIQDIERVVNFDLPDTIETYVHRCGRTARLHNPGTATSFLSLDCKIAFELKELLQSLDQDIPVELLNPQQFKRKIIATELGDRTV